MRVIICRRQARSKNHPRNSFFRSMNKNVRSSDWKRDGNFIGNPQPSGPRVDHCENWLFIAF